MTTCSRRCATPGYPGHDDGHEKANRDLGLFFWLALWENPHESCMSCRPTSKKRRTREEADEGTEE